MGEETTERGGREGGRKNRGTRGEGGARTARENEELAKTKNCAGTGLFVLRVPAGRDEVRWNGGRVDGEVEAAGNARGVERGGD